MYKNNQLWNRYFPRSQRISYRYRETPWCPSIYFIDLNTLLLLFLLTITKQKYFSSSPKLLFYYIVFEFTPLLMVWPRYFENHIATISCTWEWASRALEIQSSATQPRSIAMPLPRHNHWTTPQPSKNPCNKTHNPPKPQPTTLIPPLPQPHNCRATTFKIDWQQERIERSIVAYLQVGKREGEKVWRAWLKRERERERERERYSSTGVKMAKYHHFQKFVAKKHCFRTKWKSTTFYVLELTKLEF